MVKLKGCLRTLEDDVRKNRDGNGHGAKSLSSLSNVSGLPDTYYIIVGVPSRYLFIENLFLSK